MKVGKSVVLAVSLAVSMSAFADSGFMGSGSRDGGGTIGSGTLAATDGGGGTIGSGTRSGLIGSGTRSSVMGSGGYVGGGLSFVTDAFGGVYLLISDGVNVLIQALD